MIAFSSRYAFPEKIEYPFDPTDLAEDNNSHIWVARVEEVSDTVWYYRITDAPDDDFDPAWSPDGNYLAFERTLGQSDERQIFAIEVSDPANPGVTQQVTNRQELPENNFTPSWVILNGETWISFVNSPKGGGDSDIALLRFPALDQLVWISIDPSDFAEAEGGVMSYVFEDEQASGNGSNRLVFASPNRQRVGDIRVIARSEEQPDSSVVAPIFINNKPSGKFTPYTFRYRPAGVAVEITGTLPGYCSAAGDSMVAVPDVVSTFLIDFIHTHGTLGVRSNPGGRLIFIDGQQPLGPTGLALRTETDASKYVYVTCVSADVVHTVRTEDVFGNPCGQPQQLSVAAGDTAWVSFDCATGLGLASEAAPAVLDRQRAWHRAEPAGALLTQSQTRGIWLVDLGTELDISDDTMYQIRAGREGANRPVLSPDGKYVAYFEGQYTSWRIVVADVTPLVEGSGPVVLRTIGLPGSTEDFECWRKPQTLSWLPLAESRKIVVSMSPCRGGAVEEYGIWVADLSRFLD